MALNAGAIRFNTDSSQMEIYDGNQWTGILATSTVQQTGGTRAFRGGGDTQPTFNDTIEFFNVDTAGNATDFGGDTTNAFNYTSAGSSSTRGVIAGGNNDTPSSDTYYNVIQKVEILSSGNAVDFGDLLAAISSSASASNGHGGL